MAMKYKILMAIGVMGALAGIALAVFGFISMIQWQNIITTGNNTSQSPMALTGTIGLIKIVVGIGILIGGVVLTWWAYDNRYNS